MYWAASSISQFQFDLIKLELTIPTLTSIEETRHFIKNATKKMDAFSISFSGGFYFVLLAGLASLVSFATQTCSQSSLALRYDFFFTLKNDKIDLQFVLLYLSCSVLEGRHLVALSLSVYFKNQQ